MTSPSFNGVVLSYSPTLLLSYSPTLQIQKSPKLYHLIQMYQFKGHS
jgi:hypothetical protein